MERVEHLLSYLRELRALNEEGYTCTREIDECIAELRTELDIGKKEFDSMGIPINVEMDSATKQHLEFLKNNPPFKSEDQEEVDKHYDRIQADIDERRERMRTKGKQIGKQKG